jgi:hypothetical protein
MNTETAFGVLFVCGMFPPVGETALARSLWLRLDGLANSE